MNVQAIKDVVFRHGEKIILAGVVVFVGITIFGYFAAGGGGGGGLGGPIRAGGGGAQSKAIEPAFVKTTQPYVAEVRISTTPRTPFWAPMTIYLPNVSKLQVKENPRVVRTADTTIIGQPRKSRLTAAEEAAVAPEGRPIERDGRPTPDCVVKVSVGADGKQIIFEAVQHGYWVAYDAMLADENKCRVLVHVRPPGWIQTDELVVVKREDCSCKEEELGVVVFRFKQPPKKDTPTDPGSREIKTYHLPIEYRIYRKSEYEEKRRLIATLPAKGAGAGLGPRAPRAPRSRRRRPPPSGYPGGFPGARPGMRPGVSQEAIAEGRMGVAPLPGRVREPAEYPAPGAAREAEIKPASEDEYVFVDRSVESEVTYEYWLENIPPLIDAEKQLEPKTIAPPLSLKTKQKFTFAYEGGTPREAKIRVYIGPAGSDVSEVFLVPIGGRIGDLSPIAAPTPAEGEPEAARPAVAEPGAKDKEEPEAPLFVTRHVLVDIVPNAFRVVPHVRAVSQKDEDGNIILVKKTVLREELARQVIIRDRKRRLVRLWYKRSKKPARAKAAKAGRPPRRAKRPARAVTELGPAYGPYPGRPRRRP